MVSKQTLNSEAFSSSLLGIESRSILKSIQTEYTKLSQSALLTRSDLHYFRARYNYYRLSLLRLPQEERVVLEPFLGRFIEQIISAEGRDGGAPEAPPPFLQSVTPAKQGNATVPGNVVESVGLSAPVNLASPRQDIRVSAQREISASTISGEGEALRQAVSELQLLKLSLQAELGSESKKILADSIDRIIFRIEKSL